jgi:ABC-type bacteriocin/lantibiotic exporter with double-glycine peptidase domain
LLPLAVLPLQGLLTRLVQARQGAVADLIREKKSRLRRTVQEALQGIETIQALGAQQAFLDRIEADAESLNDERGQSGAYASLMTAAVWAMPGLAVAGSWFLGGSRVLSGEISTGQLVAFAGFVAYLGVPLRRFARLARTTREAMQSLRRVSHLLNAASADRNQQGSTALRPVRGEVRLSGVVAGDAAQPVLRGLNCTFPAGEFLWLRGASGTGKSTLLKLLACMDSPHSGRIEIDGQCLEDCTADSVRRAVALVPQQAMVFTGTVAENLRLAGPGCSDDALRDACHRAGLRAWLDALPQGFETPLGERGARLSGGEAQRLSVARALLRQPSVLLLDEPTAALDPVAEEQLLATLATLAPEVTVILVAHRLRSLRGIHRVMLLQDGQIAEWPCPSGLTEEIPFVQDHFEASPSLRLDS